MNSNNIQAGPSRLAQLFSAARSFRPSSLLDPNYRRSLLNELSGSFTTPQPVISHTGGVMGHPAGFNSWNEQPYHSGQMPYDYGGTRTSSYHGLDTRDNLLGDNGSHFYGNDIEEQMIQAAIEASKQEDSSGRGLVQTQLELPEDDEFSRAISLSLKTAEQEKTMRGQGVKDRDQKLEVYDLVKEAGKTNNSTRKLEKSSVQEGAQNMCTPSPVSYKSEHDVNVHTQCSRDAFSANEKWGDISSKELDEAVMLEAALFGKAATGFSKYLQSDPHSNAGPGSSSASHASSSVMAQQSLREQQDNEYLASLLADREKEMNALKEAESLQLSSDESQKKILEEEKLERWLAAKETSLPQEPAIDDENVVSLVVKMPDGSRRGRRFLKTDRLQVLFDFIDVGREVKSGTYRVVRPYPRRAFSVSDGSSSLNELGLTSKQEALFLEFI